MKKANQEQQQKPRKHNIKNVVGLWMKLTVAHNSRMRRK